RARSDVLSFPTRRTSDLAIAEGGAPVFDADLLGRLGLREADLEATVAAERAELDRRVEVYRRGRPLPETAGRPVIVVDDGLATGDRKSTRLNSSHVKISY